ncbi:FecR domain-containing protein [Undibacterium sp. CY18W]|uniref:FecR domain-containing protein n=1 Tax=Undibacterium hunanense TaxID=2762292 RepID=A0ABR6ZKW6_9BURK|nr:FecR domain-containing protein [Undibacterium hunanense]MBC3916199.1 FecR domain-containing protein [Undibacterium hunanense]
MPPAVARRAVEWLVELQSYDASDVDGVKRRQAMQQWLAQHPDHQRAWQRIEAVNGQLFGNLQRTASPVAAAIAHATLATPRSVKRREAIKTLAVMLFAGGTAWVAQDQIPWHEWTADERTGVGQRRTVTLADGTTVALNTSSAINVRFNANQRQIVLLGGEILVSTGKDGSGRPFIVETAQGELQPLGTRFAVRQQAYASRVDVFEGAVAIRPRDLPAGKALILHAGEQTSFTHSTIADPQPANDDSIAWTDGMLVASSMRLADFLAELGRHRPGYLGCDPAIAGLRVSGTYPLADTERILQALCATLPVDIHFLTRYWVMVRPARV